MKITPEKAQILKSLKELKNLDPLVEKAKQFFISSNLSSNYRFPDSIITRDENIDIAVTPKQIQKALLFMDIFIKEIIAKGYTIIVRNLNDTIITIDNINFYIKYRDRYQSVMIEEGKHKSYVPTGLSVFEIWQSYSNKKEWIDKAPDLKEKIPDILRWLDKAIPQITNERRERDEIQQLNDIRFV